jgi:predicted DNA-binding WGR domain protein
MRLELHDRVKNSHKYYQLVEMEQGMVDISWGRCLGRDTSGGERLVDRDLANKLLQQKIKKGYKIV